MYSLIKYLNLQHQHQKNIFAILFNLRINRTNNLVIFCSSKILNKINIVNINSIILSYISYIPTFTNFILDVSEFDGKFMSIYKYFVQDIKNLCGSLIINIDCFLWKNEITEFGAYYAIRKHSINKNFIVILYCTKGIRKKVIDFLNINNLYFDVIVENNRYKSNKLIKELSKLFNQMSLETEMLIENNLNIYRKFQDLVEITYHLNSAENLIADQQLVIDFLCS